MRSSLEKHIPSLDKSLLNEFIAVLSCFSWLPTSCQEDSAFLILHTHEVGWDLDVHYVGSVAMSAEVVHEEIVSVVNKEVKSVQHVPIVLKHWDL